MKKFNFLNSDRNVERVFAVVHYSDEEKKEKSVSYLINFDNVWMIDHLHR